MNHVTNVKDDVVFVEDTAAPLSKNNVEEELASHLDCLDKAGGEDFEDSWVVKRLVRKVDYRLMPILSLTYSFSLIDRVNLPNARIAGMGTDLGLSIAARYSILSMIFFIPYVLFQIPANWCLRSLGPVIWLPTIALAFGILTIGMGFTHSWTALLGCRIIMGALEAGYYPGCVFLISCWYVRYETQLRFGLFFVTGLLASGFGGILAYGLSQMDGVGGLEGWRWIFIIEGIVTCVLSLAGYALLVGFPDQANKPGLLSEKPFLNEDEVALVLRRISQDRPDATPEKFSFKAIVQVLSDWKIWHFALINMLNNIVTYSYNYFLPIILKADMGFSTTLAQVLTFPPYPLAALWMLFTACLCDKFHVRGPFIIFNCFIAVIGLCLTAFLESAAGRYVGVFLGIAAVSSNVPAILSYQHNNIVGQAKRAIGSAFLIGSGAVGGIIATNIFREQDYPQYRPGLWTTIGAQVVIICLTGASIFVFRRANRLADLHKTDEFRYTI